MASGKIPTWVWVFTPTLTIAFVGFLLYLSTLPAGDDIDKITSSLEQKAKTALQTTAAKKTGSASEQPSEENKPKQQAKVDEYEFYQLLENKKVDVPEVKEYKSTPKGVDKDGKKIIYRLRVGSFGSKEGADRQKAMLTLNGFDTQIEAADVNGKTYHRVFVGPYDNRSKMKKAKSNLLALDIQSMVVKE